MASDDEPDSGHARDLEPIPEELQELSTEELVESDYEAVPLSEQDEVRAGKREHFDAAAMSSPGRTHLPEPTPMEEYPRKYWDNCEPEYWVDRAKAWSRLPDEFKEAIPDDYRQLVQKLRRWEPWEKTKTEPAQDEALDNLEAELDLDEEVEKEAEQLLNELEDEQTE